MKKSRRRFIIGAVLAATAPAAVASTAPTLRRQVINAAPSAPSDYAYYDLCRQCLRVFSNGKWHDVPDYVVESKDFIPSQCAHCGTIVQAGASKCSVCGAPT